MLFLKREKRQQQKYINLDTDTFVICGYEYEIYGNNFTWIKWK